MDVNIFGFGTVRQLSDPALGGIASSAIRRSRSPEPSLIKGENTPLDSRPPSRRAGIQLRRAQQQMAVKDHRQRRTGSAPSLSGVPRPLRLTPRTSTEERHNRQRLRFYSLRHFDVTVCDGDDYTRLTRVASFVQ